MKVYVLTSNTPDDFTGTVTNVAGVFQTAEAAKTASECESSQWYIVGEGWETSVDDQGEWWDVACFEVGE